MWEEDPFCEVHAAQIARVPYSRLSTGFKTESEKEDYG
jgi:hypothetical protein